MKSLAIMIAVLSTITTRGGAELRLLKYDKPEDDKRYLVQWYGYKYKGLTVEQHWIHTDLLGVKSDYWVQNDDPWKDEFDIEVYFPQYLPKP